MSFSSLSKVNRDSVRVQHQIEYALEIGDTYEAKRLISESIVDILKAGLTPNQKRNLDELKQIHYQEMHDLIESAFQRGWVRDGKPNLSNAMDEVLIEVAERIRQAREEGECDRLPPATTSSRAGTKANAVFWSVAFFFISILVFRYASGWWTVFGYLASFLAFGAFLELFRKAKR